MPVRIRLQRHGKKGKPFYWIVAADSRSKRDGRYLEKLGTYNPNTNPAAVNINVEGAIKWLENGAQPSDTARTLLSYRGVMIKHHLNGGVKKGAFTQEDADKKFAAWLEEKSSKIQAKIDGLDKDKAESLAKRLEVEKAINQKRIDDLAAKPEIEEVDENDASPKEQASEVINEKETRVSESLSEESKSENSEEVVNEVEPNEVASETFENVSSEEPANSDVVEESADIKETVIEEDDKDNKENVVEAEGTKEEVASETSQDFPVEDSVPSEKEEASTSEDASEEEVTKK